MNKRNFSTVAIWAEHPFQLYSAVEFIRLNKDLGNDLTIITEARNAELLKSNEVLNQYEHLFIDHYKKKWHSYFRLFFEALFVPNNFSSLYSYISTLKHQRFVLLTIFQKLSIIKLSGRKINSFFHLLVQIGRPVFSPRKILFDKIFCFTKVHNAVLLGVISKKRIAIMESWDHPMKFPFLFKASEVYTWNKSLLLDIQKFQGIKNVKQITPLKFNYIDRFRHLEIEEIEASLLKTSYSSEVLRIKDKNIVLYPTTTSSIGNEHEGEIQLIHSLSKAFVNKKYFLYIKPKPNGPEGDYDMFCGSPQVLVGMYSSNFDSRDMLDDNYHLFRYYLIRKAIQSINVGTTFGLEIAYADRPLIQLDILDSFHLGLARFVHTYHLSNYLLSLEGTTPFDGATETIFKQIDNADMTFSRHLKDWLIKW